MIEYVKEFKNNYTANPESGGFMVAVGNTKYPFLDKRIFHWFEDEENANKAIELVEDVLTAIDDFRFACEELNQLADDDQLETLKLFRKGLDKLEPDELF